MVASQPIARYSAKALDQFEAQVIELLTTNTALIANDAVREAWNRATLIAMGGDGTHGA
jgi:diacylglycerol kinase family enzyme